MCYIENAAKRILLLVLFLTFVNNCLAYETFSTDRKIALEGMVSKKQFLDANDKKETAVILTLNKPINVYSDEFGGPASDITEIQLAFPMKINPKSYIGKRVHVTGRLFYPITAHHHTNILLEVESIF